MTYAKRSSLMGGPRSRPPPVLAPPASWPARVRSFLAGAQILDGLRADDRVVLFPSDQITTGRRVTPAR